MMIAKFGILYYPNASIHSSFLINAYIYTSFVLIDVSRFLFNTYHSFENW